MTIAFCMMSLSVFLLAAMLILKKRKFKSHRMPYASKIPLADVSGQLRYFGGGMSSRKLKLFGWQELTRTSSYVLAKKL